MDDTIRAKLDQHVIKAQSLLFRSIAGGLFEIMPHWIRGYSGLRWPTFNIFMPRDSSGLDEDTLADTAAFFSSRNALYSVELVHDLLPDGPDLLNSLRYQSLPPQPAMALAALPSDLSLNPAVKIERVATVPALTAFCTTLYAVFDYPLQDTIKRFPVSQLKDERIWHYLAFLDEQPVSAGSVVCVGQESSVWNLGTIDAYRGRGVATTLLHRMLTDARQAGCELSMLYSTAQAYPFFNQFGFEIYTQRQWFLPPGLEYGDDEESDNEEEEQA